MITFVTAYYKRPEKEGKEKENEKDNFKNRGDEKYFHYFLQLIELKLPFLVFLDPCSYKKWLSMVSSFSSSVSHDHVRVIPIPYLDMSWVPKDVKLPQHRNEKKDTVWYLCVQLQKFYCLQQARLYSDSDFFAWVDFGIFHVITDRGLAYHRLQSLSSRTFRHDRIISPGCENYFQDPSSDTLWEQIYWKFCGCFFIGHRNIWLTAYDLQMKVVESYLPRLTWEINYWVMMNQIGLLSFSIYPSDHNDRIFQIPLFPCGDKDGVWSDSEIIHAVQPYTNISIERLENIFLLLERCIKEKIDGDFVSIGIGNGGVLIAMALKCKQLGVTRTIQGYRLDDGEGNQDLVEWFPIVKDDLLLRSMIHIHVVEWTTENLVEKEDSIAFLHIDTNRYEFVNIALQTFGPKVCEYGYFVVDDYGYCGGAKKAVEEYCPPSLHMIGHSAVWWQVDYGRRDLERLREMYPHNEYLSVLSTNFHHFIGLYNCVKRKFIHGCGSYLFGGQQYKYLFESWKKQDALFRVGKQVSRVLEVGVYLGHSLLILLISNPHIQIDCIDIDTNLSPKAVDYLNKEFGGRIFLSCGPALDILYQWSQGDQSSRHYDLIHIDADHYINAVTQQFELCRKWADPKSFIVFDDYEAVSSCIDNWIQEKQLEHVETPGGSYTNIVTRLNSDG